MNSISIDFITNDMKSNTKYSNLYDINNDKVYQMHKMNYEKSLIKVINEPRLKPKAIKQDIFNLTHLYENSDYENIYLFSKTTYIALMFYLRNIRNIGDMGDITRGRGERYLSYTMALWLLRRDPDLFDKNIYLFVSELGFFKDCLSMAKIAKSDNYTNQEIDKILMPMAMSLIEDDYNIVKSFIDKKTMPYISLASKWAPREGKSFDEFIPNIQRLCKIKTKNSKESWRKFIRNIINKSPNPTTIETLLSEKKYDEVDFSDIPSKAFKLYKNHFKKNIYLRDRFGEYVNNKNIQKINKSNISSTYSIIKPYIYQFLNNKFEVSVNKPIIINDWVEVKWLNYTNSIIIKNLNKTNYNFIPMIDISASMFMYDSVNISMALTFGILLSQLSSGFMENKAITFSTKPTLYNITGNTLCKKVECIFKELIGNREDYCSTDFIKAFECLLEHCKSNNIPNSYLMNTKIIVFTDMEYDKCCDKNQDDELLKKVINKFNRYGYTDLPKIILWNMTGNFCIKEHNNYITRLNGFDESIINNCIIPGNITPVDISFNLVKKYFSLVTI